MVYSPIDHGRLVEAAWTDYRKGYWSYIWAQWKGGMACLSPDQGVQPGSVTACSTPCIMRISSARSWDSYKSPAIPGPPQEPLSYSQICRLLYQTQSLEVIQSEHEDSELLTGRALDGHLGWAPKAAPAPRTRMQGRVWKRECYSQVDLTLYSKYVFLRKLHSNWIFINGILFQQWFTTQFPRYFIFVLE